MMVAGNNRKPRPGEVIKKTRESLDNVLPMTQAVILEAVRNPKHCDGCMNLLTSLAHRALMPAMRALDSFLTKKDKREIANGTTTLLADGTKVTPGRWLMSKLLDLLVAGSRLRFLPPYSPQEITNISMAGYLFGPCEWWDAFSSEEDSAKPLDVAMTCR